LISINNKLQQPEAARGVLDYAIKNHRADVRVQETWYEKLQDWTEALRAYEKRQESNRDDVGLTLGRMRCLESLGEWGQLYEIANDSWDKVNDNVRGQMAKMSSAAAWGLQQWDKMEKFVNYLPEDSLDGSFHRAVFEIHNNNFPFANYYIDAARDILDTDLTAMVGESYQRAYGSMVTVQMLSELEEVIVYKLIPDSREKIKLMWWNRLQGCQRKVEDWAHILHVRSLVMTPQEDVRTWLKFASLCRKSGRITLASRTLTMLLGYDPVSRLDNASPSDRKNLLATSPVLELSDKGLLATTPMGLTLGNLVKGQQQQHTMAGGIFDHCHIAFSVTKHLHCLGKKNEAFAELQRLVQYNLHPLVLQHFGPNAHPGVAGPLPAEVVSGAVAGSTGALSAAEQQKQTLNKLLAKCYLKLGDWLKEIQELEEESIPRVLEFYNLATEHDPTWYKAWHAWALNNFEAVSYYKQKLAAFSNAAGGSVDDVDASFSAVEGGDHVSNASGSISSPQGSRAMLTQCLQKFLVPAVSGFFRSITLSDGPARGNSLQDTLRLLGLWFDYGHLPEVYEALVEGINKIQIDNWLQVIPQLIARIDMPRQLVRKLIHQLFVDIGKYHPQALIYPLTVASKSNEAARCDAANRILKNMCEHSDTLVQQAMLVSEELIRVAILWHELWHEGLEEASRLYFGERNIKGMFATLEPLHAMMERGPQTLKETSFQQSYGRELMEAAEWCRKYTRSGNMKDLNQAWDLYYHVFRRISKQLPQLTALELHYVSPKLLMCHDLELAVPGTYDPNKPVVRISKVESALQVITSKQRPRKLCIRGSNGKEFMFLLKGHEDLRQDERVMQLFGLVNTLLSTSHETLRRNLTIQRFSVVPLSTNSGLIGWVPNCDTLHALIRDYREKKKIMLNIEHRIMLRMAPDYDHLTLMQKVEVFEHAIDSTKGDDLAKILWNKSPNSEIWFDRRTNYTRSLAVMSMVGYILGLGDRHPSNLMLDRLSGKIMHIDFGDCFEVAMTREKFPEKIPFRLTRMLINAMEVTGIEGNYRTMCESVIKVMRENKDSVMAVLEAFVYDPLLNWRLMDIQSKEAASSKSRGAADGDGAAAEGADGAPSRGGSRSSRVSVKGAAPNADQLVSMSDDGEPEALNTKALAIVTRVRDKLTGRDFATDKPIDVAKQVELLIQQATSHENLCQCYIGWCPFW